MENLEIFHFLVYFFLLFLSFLDGTVFRKLVVRTHRREKLVNGIQMRKIAFIILI